MTFDDINVYDAAAASRHILDRALHCNGVHAAFCLRFRKGVDKPGVWTYTLCLVVGHRDVDEEARKELELRPIFGEPFGGVLPFLVEFKWILNDEITSIILDMRHEIENLATRLSKYEALAPELRAAAETIDGVEEP